MAEYNYSGGGKPQMTPQNEGEQRNNRNMPKKDNSKKIMLGVIAVLLVILLGAFTWFALSTAANKKALETERLNRQQAELDLEQAQMTADFDELNRQYSTLENQRIEIMDDSVKRDLEEKYEAAKLKVEKLQQELKNQKNMSAAEIKKLKNEIATLREILRNYVEQINQLNQENQQLRAENEQLQNDKTRLTSQVNETTRRNEVLNERMTLAEKLNVTGVMIQALNKKGKNEKKVEKAHQLMVSFTIPQNNSTPVGEKTIYLRIISPSGQLLGNGGSFPFEGTTLQCTAKKVIQYAGEEIGGITIYWDVDTALSPGSYTVELFTDGYRLCSRHLNL